MCAEEKGEGGSVDELVRFLSLLCQSAANFYCQLIATERERERGKAMCRVWWLFPPKNIYGIFSLLLLLFVVVVVHLMSTVSQATHSKNKQQTVSGPTASAAAAATTCHLPQPSPCGVGLASAVSASFSLAVS